MKLLAFDTSSVACTVGVLAGERVVERHEEKAREHTRILMPMIRSCLEEASVALPELDAIVVGNGPGSFIGMRIAASVAQGLAYGAGLDIVPVSSMAAVAAEAGSGGDTVVVTQDAHMNEVYLGIYRIGPNRLPEPLVDERLHGQDAIGEFESLSGRGRDGKPSPQVSRCADLQLRHDLRPLHGVSARSARSCLSSAGGREQTARQDAVTDL